MNKLNILLFLLLSFLFGTTVFSQNIRALEDQLQKTNDPNEQMRLFFELSQKYLNSDPAKASDLAHRAYNLATDLKNNAMMGRSAYVNAEGFLRRRDLSNAKIRFERSLGHAKAAGDGQVTLGCYKKLQDIAIQSNDYRAAYQYSQQAFETVKKGVRELPETMSSSSAPAPSSWQKEKEQLIKEKRALEQQLANASNEKEELDNDRSSLVQDKRQLAIEKAKIESELTNTSQFLNEKEKTIKNMSTQQARLEAIKANREKQIALLKKEQIQDSLSAQKKLVEKDLALAKNANLRNILILLTLSGLILAGLSYSRFQTKKKANIQLEEKNKIIEEEQGRSEKLLLNILPPAIAEELKTKGKAQARRYENATVLFTDFKNFTNIAEQLTPEELVKELDFYFKGFDTIIRKYNIEKIKTIGDSYMCAAGLSGKKSDSTDMVRAALAMQTFMNDARYQKMENSLPFFEARIGIHTGPVVAGVVGDDKFAYDIWGDTVNTASRMEQNCEPGHINISESTYWQIKYSFECRYRGKLAAKNKGEIDMYYVIKETE